MKYSILSIGVEKVSDEQDNILLQSNYCQLFVFNEVYILLKLSFNNISLCNFCKTLGELTLL